MSPTVGPSAGSLLAPQPAGIPVPRPSERSRPFWEGCRRHQLLLPRCPSCGAYALRAFAVCARCRGTGMRWEPSDGCGALYSWTVVRRAPHPAFVVPYAPAVIALDEGCWLLSAVVGCRPDELGEGMRLQVTFHPLSDDVTLPYFRPAAY